MILIIGGDSFIGLAATYALRDKGYDVISTTRNLSLVTRDRPYLDLNALNKSHIKAISCSVDYVLLAAGVTSITNCEKNKYATSMINEDGLATVARILGDAGATIILLSSSAVFGKSQIAPTPLDSPNPVVEYGKQKLALETILLNSGCKTSILRLTKVINPETSIFSMWINILNSGGKVSAFSNVAVAPITIEYCTGMISYLIAPNRTGVFHLSPSTYYTYYEIASYIARKLKQPETNVFPELCRNPLYENTCFFLSGDIEKAGVEERPDALFSIDDLISRKNKLV